MPISDIKLTWDQWGELNQLMNLSQRIAGQSLNGRMALASVGIEWDKEMVKIIVKGGEKG